MTVFPLWSPKQIPVPGLATKILPLLLAGAALLPGHYACAQTLASVTLAWSPSSSSGLAGYRLHWGGASRTYTNALVVGMATNGTIAGLQPGVTCYCAVTDYTAGGLESLFSNEISYTPAASAPLVVVTAPANGASFTAPANISLAATVTPNGHTISQVQFYNGPALLGQRAAAPYGCLWTNVGSGSYSLSAVALYDATNRVASSPVSVTVVVPPPSTNLPAPWQTADLGNVGLTGRAAIAGGLYTVVGAGNLSGTADNFRFLYQAMSGDGEIRAQIRSLQGGNSGARAGVMIRETLTPGSRYAFMGLPPTDKFRSQRRVTTSGTTSATSSGSSAPPNTWVRLVRQGNSVCSYRSTDGANWSQVSSNGISMASNIYFGFAVASGATNTFCTSTFTNATVLP